MYLYYLDTDYPCIVQKALIRRSKFVVNVERRSLRLEHPFYENQEESRKIISRGRWQTLPDIHYIIRCTFSISLRLQIILMRNS